MVVLLFCSVAELYPRGRRRLNPGSNICRCHGNEPSAGRWLERFLCRVSVCHVRSREDVLRPNDMTAAAIISQWSWMCSLTMCRRISAADNSSYSTSTLSAAGCQIRARCGDFVQNPPILNIYIYIYICGVRFEERTNNVLGQFKQAFIGQKSVMESL